MTPIRLAAAVVALLVIAMVAYSRRGFMRLEAPDAVAPDRVRGSVDVLVLAACLALAVGIVEVGLVVFRQEVLERLAFWRMNAAWLTPVTYLALFAVPAVILAVATAAIPRRVPLQAAVFVLGSIAIWAVLLSFPRIHRVAKAVLTLGIATRLAFWTATHAPKVRVWSRRALAMGAIITAVLFGVTTGSEGLRERREIGANPPPGGGAPNVLLLFLDTVRAASLSVYGYERPTTPRLELLAEESVVFDWPISASSWTLDGHVAALTGLFPHESGAGRRRPLSDEHPTLAEAFLAGGYGTAGFVANRRYCGAETGLGRGFAHYEGYLGMREPFLAHSLLGQTAGVRRLAEADSPGALLRALWRFGPSLDDDQRHLPHRPVTDIHRDFLAWLDAQDDDRPFFAFLNYMEAHDPYRAPESFLARFDDGSVPELMGRYDAAIAYLDQEIGRLLDELADRGLLDETIVVVTSDHGEHFYEEDSKRLVQHGTSLFTQVVRVPLIVRYPAALPGGVRVPDVVSLGDLPATMLELAGVPNREGIPGTSLVSRAAGGGTPALALSELALPGASGVEWAQGPPGSMYGDRPHLKSLMGDRFHYIRSWGEADEDPREIELLYDIRADPSEESDLSGVAAGRAAVERLRGSLRARFPDRP